MGSEVLSLFFILTVNGARRAAHLSTQGGKEARFSTFSARKAIGLRSEAAAGGTQRHDRRLL